MNFVLEKPYYPFFFYAENDPTLRLFFPDFYPYFFVEGHMKA